MHGYIYEGKNRYIIVFWLAVIAIMLGLGVTYTVDILVSVVEKNDGEKIFVLLFNGIFGVSSGTFFAILYFLFDRFLWKIKLFRYKNLSGIYNCLGISKDKSQKEKSQFNATIKIKQTWTKVVVYLETEQSFSESFMARIIENGIGDVRLDYCYVNSTKRTSKDLVSKHTGTASIIFSNEIQGKYYNQPDDRMRYGELTLTKER